MKQKYDKRLAAKRVHDLLVKNPILRPAEMEKAIGIPATTLSQIKGKTRKTIKKEHFQKLALYIDSLRFML